MKKLIFAFALMVINQGAYADLSVCQCDLKRLYETVIFHKTAPTLEEDFLGIFINSQDTRMVDITNNAGSYIHFSSDSEAKAISVQKQLQLAASSTKNYLIVQNSNQPPLAGPGSTNFRTNLDLIIDMDTMKIIRVVDFDITPESEKPSIVDVTKEFGDYVFKKFNALTTISKD